MNRLWHSRTWVVASLPLLLLLTVSSAGLGQSPPWHRIQLAHDISLEVPGGWRVRDFSGETPVHSADHAAGAEGMSSEEAENLLTVATPSADTDMASLSIMVLPTGVSQADLMNATDADIRLGDERTFRPDAEAAAERFHRHITQWNGTHRQMVGGRYGLLTSYRFRYPNGQEMIKQTYSAYLGSRAVHVHIFRPATAAEDVTNALDRMIKSLSIGVDSL